MHAEFCSPFWCIKYRLQYQLNFGEKLNEVSIFKNNWIICLYSWSNAMQNISQVFEYSSIQVDTSIVNFYRCVSVFGEKMKEKSGGMIHTNMDNLKSKLEVMLTLNEMKFTDSIVLNTRIKY